MGHLFVPVGADGTPLQVERDQAGQTVRVKGVSKSGVNQMDFSGAWPNEDITFSTDGVPYLYVWSSLQQLPEFAVGWNFLFTLGYRSADAELIYEVVLPMNGVLGKADYFPAIASRLIGGKRDAAARGYYQYSTRSFFNVTAIDSNARIDSPYSVFSLPSHGKPADLAPGATMGLELGRASFFLPQALPLSGGTVAVPYSFPGWDHFLWHAVAFCAAGGAFFGWAGCGAGALGVALAELGDLAIDWIKSTIGGGGAHDSPPSNTGTPPPGGGELPKKKTDG
jgi:hypothetical protein